MNDKRQDPEKLLKRVQNEELQASRGKLKIYLGAAPGVGKTYTMLQDAIAKRKQGIDIMVGVVESHGRKDIENLLQGLEILPKQVIEYKNKLLEEFDLDAALMRNPATILIDEMAHSNVEGTRHAKRWKDIKELLYLGIDVYTTLNVQHIESLNDDVSAIIHAPIKETVPDSMLELAETIELIDLPPEDLLKRLQDGKVYLPEHAELARENFFRKGNLIALRELALRVTAARVGAQVLLYRQGQGIRHIWSSNEKILVCVGPGGESLKLIRAACRLATSLQATWSAVYVDSPRVRLSEQERNNAIKNLRLAEQLGAETRIISGFDLVAEIINYAREQNVTLIMIWKRIRSKWFDIFTSRLADEIVRNSYEINVYIMTGKYNAADDKQQKHVPKTIMLRRVYMITIGIVIMATMINYVLFQFVSARNLILVYLVAVTIVSLFGRVWPSILASILSVAAYGVFFAPDLLSFSITNFEYLSTLVIMILLTQVISHLTILTRRQAESARISERQATALHKLSRQLASTRGVDKLLEIGSRYLAEIFDSEVMALLPIDHKLVIKAKVGTEQALDDKEFSIAQWVYDLGQIAGLGTDTLPFSKAIYVPLLASQGTMGVLRVCPKNQVNLLTPEQMHFLETCANQIALTIEVDHLQEKNKQTEFEKEIDHTRSVLLQSVSQDLRAPLASIMLSASTQMQLAKDLDSDRITQIGQIIYSEAEQLSRLINNLLQITYLEKESIKLQKKPASLKDLVNNVLKASREKLGKIPVYIKIPLEIPEIPYDNTLLEEVMFNLLDNAIKFAPEDKAIEIYAEMDKDKVIVSIEDHGPGIVDDEVNKLFEKFYRGRMLTTKRGLGLGLAICRIIIEAHGGNIWAENREGGGAAFKFSLPLAT